MMQLLSCISARNVTTFSYQKKFRKKFLPTHAKSEVEKDAQIRLAFSNGVFKTSKKEFLEIHYL
jgi:hypothetical protein